VTAIAIAIEVSRMKIYVLGYKSKPEERLDPKRPWENIDIWYSKEPEWTMDYREEAVREFEMLTKMRPHVQEHFCDLELEELPDSKFSIFCKDHPEIRRR
jgi:hypothetical protein